MGFARGQAHPDVLLERAGIILLEAEKLEATVGVFVLLTKRKPHYTMAWYALGQCFMRLSHMAKGEKYLQYVDFAAKCYRRSLIEDKNNKLSASLLDAMKYQLTPEMRASTEYFNGDTQELLSAIDYSPQMLVEAVKSLPKHNDRMMLVMLLGEQEEASFLPLVIDAVENDPHYDVRMAALKRLVFYPHFPEVRICLERLIQSGAWKDLALYPEIVLDTFEQKYHLEWATPLLKVIDETEKPSWQKIPVPKPDSSVYIYASSEPNIESFAHELELLLDIRNVPPPWLADGTAYLYEYSKVDPMQWFCLMPNGVSANLNTNSQQVAQYKHKIILWSQSSKAPQPIAAARHFGRILFDKLKATGRYPLLMIDETGIKLGQFDP